MVSAMKLYERLANELQQRMTSGLYPAGHRLPSIREMSVERGVSISTVQEAYRRLEEQGLVESRPKSGYFVRARQATSALPQASRPAQRPIEVSQWADVLELLSGNEDKSVLALGRGVPEHGVPTLEPLMRELARINRAADMRGMEYDGLAGTRRLREQIVRLMTDSGCEQHPDDIIITSGCQEALSIAMRAITRPGDVVAVDSPSFYGSMQIIRAFGLKVMEIPTDPETGISLEALELALEQWPISALQLTPTCNNPLGYTMPEDRKRKLVALAQRFDLAIIEDDIYGDLSFQYPRPRAIKSFDTDGRVLLCSSFSKTTAPGMRVGWVAPGRYRDRVLHTKYVSTGATAVTPQLAVAEFVARGDYERHLRRVRPMYRRGRDAMLDWVSRHFPAGTRISYPQGGFLLWVELPGELDTLLLNKRLPALGMRIAPGVLFSASGKYRNCLRLNYASEPTPRLEQAIRTVGEVASEMLAQADVTRA